MDSARTAPPVVPTAEDWRDFLAALKRIGASADVIEWAEIAAGLRAPRRRRWTMKKKLSAGAIGGAVSIILVWALGEFAGVTMPGEVAAAVGVLAVTGVSLLIPDEMEEP